MESAPGNLTVQNMEGRLSGPFILYGVRYQIQDNEINAERLELEWRPLELISGRAHVQRLHVDNLTITLPPSKTDEKQTTPLTLPDIRLPLVLVMDDTQLNAVRVLRAGDSLLALNQTRLKARAGPLQLRLDELAIQTDTYQVTLDGQLSPYDDYRHYLNLNWRYKLTNAPSIQGSGVLQGDINNTRLNQTLTGLLDAELQLKLNNPLNELRWQADTNIRGFDTRRVNPEWPELTASLNMQVEGNISSANANGTYKSDYTLTGALNGDFRIQFREDKTLLVEHLTAQTSKGSRAVANGEWVPGGNYGETHLAIKWENLGWPLNDAPKFTSKRGALQLSGNPDNYKLSLAGDLTGNTLPPGFWRSTGHGDLSQLNLQRIQIDTLDGSSLGQGQVAWQPQLQWTAKLHGENFNPATLLPQWPGKLAFDIRSEGKQTEEGLVTHTDLKHLSGKLREQPVELHTQVDTKSNNIVIENLKLRSGRAKFSAKGSIGDTFNLSWKLQAPELDELIPDAHGILNAHGRFLGPQQTPQITLDLNGQQLVYRDYKLENIQSTANVDLGGDKAVRVNLKTTNLQIGNRRFNQIQTTLGGSAVEHRLKIDATTARTSLKLNINGQLKNQHWQGRLTQADVTAKQLGTWRLEQTASVQLMALTSLQTDPLCWSNKPSRFCLQMNYKNGEWNAQTKGRMLNLAWLDFLVPEGMEITGNADLDASGHWQASASPEINADITLGSGSISYPLIEGERDRWDYQSGSLNARLDASGVSSQLQLSMLKEDQLNAQLNLPGFDLLQPDIEQQPIQGKVRVSFGNLDLIEILLPEVQQPQGNLNIAFDIQGTFRQPLLKGQAELNNGNLLIPRLGLTLKNISINARSESADILSFNIGAESGDGKVQIKGTTKLNADEGWPTTAKITGENFQVSVIPEARVQVSPDLNISIQRREIHINGVVNVPYARIQPKDVTSAVTVSSDTVIVGQKQTVEEKWLIYTEVRMILGKRVSYYGHGFEGRVEGNVVLRDEPGQLTTASGELTIPDGRYEAYGQQLSVNQGRILFTGGPVTNPGLDIRAVRTVVDVVAGIRVQGTLQSPQLELFSIPPMGQSDTLAYLLLGRPISGETSQQDGALLAQAALALSLKGGDTLARSIGDRFGLEEMRIQAGGAGDEASLVIGRYLSPRIYVSYGVGLIQAVNTATISYEISRRWQFRAEAGEHQGGDFIYTIEKGN